MKKHNVFKAIKNIASVVCVFALTFLVYKTSYALISNSLTENFKIDKTTSNYLSFNYADNGVNVFEIDDVKVLSDFQGKRLLNNYFDFEVSIPKENLASENINYEVIINNMGTEIDERFIKFYLSDQNNKSLEGFENKVPVLAAFNESEDGKIIYIGSFNINNSSDKLRLRIWVSDIYDKKIKEKMIFSVKVKIK